MKKFFNFFGKLLRRWPWLLPALVAAAHGAWYVVTQPDQLYGDGAEYDEIARNLLLGRFDLGGAATMHREPLYPAFRALVYLIAGVHPQAVLWAQALLAAATVIVVHRAVRRLDARSAAPTAWALALFPGFAVYAARHFSEMFAAFLAALVGYGWIRLWEALRENKSCRKIAAWVGLALGVLVLTKAVFQLVPFLLFGILALGSRAVSRWKTGALMLLVALATVAPWILRNGRTFGTYAITYRTGIVLYTRALKAEAGWKTLASSYGSVLIGEATMLKRFPATPPVYVHLWQKTWEDKNALLAQGLSYREADALLLQRAKQKIFSSPAMTVRYLLWSPIDELRLFALVSPFSPQFAIEPMFLPQVKAGTFTAWRQLIVLAAHAVQMVWWFLIAAGFLLLLRKKLWSNPAIPFVAYVAVIYAPFDNIPRYLVPILPWMLAMIVAYIVSRFERMHGSTV